MASGDIVGMLGATIDASKASNVPNGMYGHGLCTSKIDSSAVVGEVFARTVSGTHDVSEEEMIRSMRSALRPDLMRPSSLHISFNFTTVRPCRASSGNR